MTVFNDKFGDDRARAGGDGTRRREEVGLDRPLGCVGQGERRLDRRRQHVPEALRHGRIDAKLRYVRHVEQRLGGPLHRGITARTGDVVADVYQAGCDDTGERCHDLLETDHGVVVLHVFLGDSDLGFIRRRGGDVIVDFLAVRRLACSSGPYSVSP